MKRLSRRTSPERLPGQLKGIEERALEERLNEKCHNLWVNYTDGEKFTWNSSSLKSETVSTMIWAEVGLFLACLSCHHSGEHEKAYRQIW